MKNNNKKELLTKEEVSHLDTMLRKLAMKKIVNGHLKMDFEDVVSKLWINALEIIREKGTVDFNYIAKASLYKMVDFTRYNIRHETILFRDDQFDKILPEELRNQEPNTAGTHKNDAYVFTTAKPQSADERMQLLDILNLFEEGSKEYKYVEAQMKILGIIEVEDVTELPERVVDSWIASDVLGYAGCKSNGYLRLRNKVRQILREAGYIL